MRLHLQYRVNAPSSHIRYLAYTCSLCKRLRNVILSCGRLRAAGSLAKDLSVLAGHGLAFDGVVYRSAIRGAAGGKLRGHLRTWNVRGSGTPMISKAACPSH
jgi:hypothetical protein